MACRKGGEGQQPTAAKVDPHIKSRFHWWKYKFVAQNYLRNSSGSGWDDARGCVSMEELKFAEWLTSHPKAAGMNNTQLEYWEELREIFGASRAIGSDAVQLGDAAKVMENNTVIDDLMEEDSTGFEAEAQSSTQAKGKSSTASSGQKRTRQQANEDLLSSIDGKMDKMTETIAETAHNIARMANTFCIHDDTTMRQKM
ncbi:hypothetical protein LINPERHAP2_LOCUS15358, partial [Linum perenne]